LKTRLKIENQRCFVLESDVNGAIIRREGEFYISNDLAFGLGETENAPIGNFLSSAGAGNFIVSHIASRKVILVRGALVVAHGCVPLPLIA